MRAFKPWNWVRVLVAVPLLLTAALWVMAPQLGQAQGTAPAQPTGLAAAGADRQAALTWDDPSDSSITGYEYLQAQVAKLTGSDGAADDNFGWSVAVDGDTAVVGAINDDDNGVNSGSAYVYIRQSGAWSQAAKLTASDGAPGDFFGHSVAVDGDTVVVGAYRDDENGLHSGSAYVFTKPATGWTTTSNFAAKLTASDGAAVDWFGYSVAVDGDTVVVGAHGYDDSATVSNSGSAYVFTEPATGWTTTSTAAKLTANDGAASDYFGYSVGADGDTVAVGAYFDDDNGVNSGSAYVFTEPATGWTTTSTAAKLTANDGAAGDWFGLSVSVDGDTVVVGAINDDDNGEDSGSAYVFTEPATGWTTTNTAAKLTANDGAAGDYFGSSVAVDGDTVVVGAYGDDDNGENSGSGYVFTKPATGWATATETAKLTASDGAAVDYFGLSVAVDGDTVVVGARYDGDKGSNSGSAYAYEVSDWTDVPDSAAGETNATSYTVTGLTNDVEYNFWIRAANSVGTGPASYLVAVTPTNTAPTAVDDIVTTAEDTAVDINVTANDTDPDSGTILAVTVVTTPSNGTAVIASGSTTTVTYTPNADYNGQDTFDYTVFDGTDTDTGTVTVTVTAVNDAPVALDDTATTNEDTAVDVNVVTNDTDTEGDTLSVTAVTTPSNGTAAIVSGSTTTVTYTPNADYNGQDTFDYTVFDGTDTDTGTVTVTVTAVNDAPTAVDDNAATAEDTAVDIIVVANDIDAEEDTLSVTSVTTPSNGTAAIVSGNTTTVTYTPDTDFNGQDTFDYTVFDGTGTDTGTVFVTVGRPAKPTGLSDIAGDTQAALTWDDPSNNSITGHEYLQEAQVAKLTASDGAAGDNSGSSVSVDGNTAVVSAPGENGGRGMAYVLTRQSGEWSQVAKLTASDRASNDEFGRSVSVDGDTVVVGAHYDDDNGSKSGSAYVFTKPATGWADATETAKLTASDGAVGHRFGVSVGVDGDTVVVGARLDDHNGAASGSAYMFTKPTTGWATATETAKLTASDGASQDQFGRSVGVDGDTVVVGAWGDDDKGSKSGSAYVFTKPATAGWVTATETAKLTASDGEALDYFGIAIAVDDGTVVVGAFRSNARRVNSGSAYVFTKPATGWVTATETAKLTASDGSSSDYFGIKVAVGGDTVVVSARNDNDNGADSGSAYVFKKPSSGGWSDAKETAKLTASDGAGGDYFGSSVAVDGDTVVVGARNDDDNGADSGSAYVHEVSDWTAIPDSGSGETNATSYTVTGLTNDVGYSFKIRATNSLGTSPASDAVTVTPAS